MKFEVTADQISAMYEITQQGSRNIYASGPIQVGDAERFAAFVRDRGLDSARVVFNSPGGSLVEGIKLGRLIRRLGFDTAIGSANTSAEVPPSTICASACAYAFAGGVLRFVPENGTLGLHQFRSERGPGVTEGAAQTVSGLLVSYLSEMGVDAKAFALAAVTDPEEVVWLSSQEAESLGFANNGVLPTTADVKIANMRPYLRLAQTKPELELRVLITCMDGQLSLLAGIVTDPERSAGLVDSDWLKRSYLEVDGREKFAMPGVTGAHPKESVVWLSRRLNRDDVRDLLNANELGIWLDGFGMMRVGGSMDLRSVRPTLKNYIEQCSS